MLAGRCLHNVNKMRGTELVRSILDSGLVGLISGDFILASGQMKHPLTRVQLFKRSSALRYLSLRDMVTPFVGYRVNGD